MIGEDDDETRLYIQGLIHDNENGPDWIHCLMEIEKTGTVSSRFEDAFKELLDQPRMYQSVETDGAGGFVLTDRGRELLAEYRSEAATERRARNAEGLRWDYFAGTVRVQDNQIQISAPRGSGVDIAWSRELTAEGTAFPRIGAAGVAPPPWQLESLWHVGDLVVLYGMPDTLKTFLEVDWCNCISRGVPWNGLATKQAPVVYIIAEGQEFFAVRQEAWNMAHDADEADNPFQHDAPVDLLGKANMESLLTVDQLVALLQHATPDGPAGLVVFDTLHRCMGGGSDVSDRDIGRVVEAATKIKQEVGSTVHLIHHAGWNTMHERGSNALRAAADAVFQAKVVGGQLVLTNEKQKNAARAPVRVLETREVGDALVLVPADPTVTGSTIKNLGQVRDALAAAGDEGLTHTEISTETGLSTATVYRHLAALEGAGEVGKDGRRHVLIVEA